MTIVFNWGSVIITFPLLEVLADPAVASRLSDTKVVFVWFRIIFWEITQGNREMKINVTMKLSMLVFGYL